MAHSTTRLCARTPDLFGYVPSPRYPHAPGSKEKGGPSEAAAAAIAPRAESLRLGVLKLFQAGEEMTADEIAQALGASVLAIRPRVSELYQTGAIVKTGQRRKNKSGQTGTVWRIA